MENRYLSIMIQSLEKKLSILGQLIEKNKAQAILFADESRDESRMEKTIYEKGKLIEQLESLDSGFEKVYNRLRDELTDNKAKYREEIAQMQSLIRQITEKSAIIESQEKRNYQLAQHYFKGNQLKVGQKRNSNRVAQLYKNNMRGLNIVESQFFNHKN